MLSKNISSSLFGIRVVTTGTTCSALTSTAGEGCRHTAVGSEHSQQHSHPRRIRKVSHPTIRSKLFTSKRRSRGDLITVQVPKDVTES